MEHESKVGQRFVLDLELATDLARAASSDRLADTVSYASIVEVASTTFVGHNYRLVEAAAGAIADAVLAAFPTVRGIKVTVHKPHAPIPAIFDDVGVVITRTRKD